MVVLAVSGEKQLLEVQGRCQRAGIPCTIFYEPDPAEPDGIAIGFTGLCTAPLPRWARRCLRGYSLWRP